MMVEVGSKAPAISATLSDGTSLDIGKPGSPLVIYFYPKDDTTGCTREAQDFTALAADFARAGTRVSRPGQPSGPGGAVTSTAWLRFSSATMASRSPAATGITPSASNGAGLSRHVAAKLQPSGASRRRSAWAE